MSCIGIRQCQARNITCGHAALVEDFWHSQVTHDLDRETANPGMFPTETGEWDASHPQPTFAAFLKANRRTTERRAA